MTSFLMQRTFNTLKAVDDQGRDALAKIPPGKVVVCEVKQARNPKQHNLYWGLVGQIYQNQTRYATQKQVSDMLKVAVGYCDEAENKFGKTVAIPKSMSFANMPNDEFQEFFRLVIEFVKTKIMPHLDEGALLEELGRIVGDVKTPY